jgi:hypothetical protein
LISIIDCLGPRPDHTHVPPGPRSVEHADQRGRLTLGIVSVRIAHMVPDGAPVPIQAAPATRDRIAELLEDRLRRATGTDLDPDDITRGARNIG